MMGVKSGYWTEHYYIGNVSIRLYMHYYVYVNLSGEASWSPIIFAKQTKCEMTDEDRHKRREYNQRYYYKNRDRLLAGLRADTRIRWQHKWGQDKRVPVSESTKYRNQRIKYSVLGNYSGPPPACVCCGENELGFLGIDHVKGDGAEHRKTFSGSIYRWLIRNGFPPGFQVLCHNCNFAKGHYGECPHMRTGGDT